MNSSLKCRLEKLFKKIKGPEEILCIFINDSYLHVSGFTLCHSGGSVDILRHENESVEELKERCRKRDLALRAEKIGCRSEATIFFSIHSNEVE